MRFKIDKNLKVIAAAKAERPEVVAVEFCARLIEKGMIDDPDDNWGGSVLIATGPHYVQDVCAVIAGYLYGDESRRVPLDIFDAFCALTVMGDGDCPHCGGNLIFDETEGHELNDGDYYTPNSYEIDYYIYHCAVCGETIKTEKEL